MHIHRYIRVSAAGFIIGLVASHPARAQTDGGAAPDAALRAYQTASGFLARGMNDLAADEYRRFLKDNPAHEKAAVARYGLGVALFRLKDYAGAEEEMRRLPQDRAFEFAAESALLLGQCQMAAGHAPEAAETFQRVVAEHAASRLAPDAGALRIECLYKAGRQGDALKSADDWVRRWPEAALRPRVELFAGLSLMAGNDLAGAARRFESVVTLEGKARETSGGGGGDKAGGAALTPQASLLLAQCLHRTGEAERADRQYGAIIDGPASPFVPDALLGRASLLLDTPGDGADERARRTGELLDRLIKEFPKSPLLADAQLLRARVWFDSGDFKRAAALLQRASSEAGDRADDAAYWLAKCELRAGHADRAAEQLAGAIEKFPQSRLLPEMLYDRAVALLRTGEGGQAAAISALGEFLARFPDHALAADALHLSASALHRAGKYDESLALCATFAKRFPDHALAPAVAFLAAENQLLSGDEDGAQAAYREFLARHPDDPAATRASFRLGTLLARAGDADRAGSLLEKVVDGRKTSELFRPALLVLADMAFAAQDWARCEQYCADYLSFGDEQPGADDALLKLGLSLERRGDSEKAVRAFDHLLEKFDQSPYRLHALFERGQTLVASGKSDRAAESFERVLRVSEGSSDPDAARFAPHAHVHLGAISMAAGKYDQAGEHFAAAARLATGTELEPEAVFQQALAAATAGEQGKAAGLFAHVASDFPSSKRAGEASVRAAISRARVGGTGGVSDEDALAAIESAERAGSGTGELDPALRDTLAYEKAWCLRRLNRADEAAKVLTGLVEPHDGNAPLRVHAALDLAELRIDAKDYGAATDLLQSIRSTAQADPGAVPAPVAQRTGYQLGVCAFRQDRFEDASKFMQEFLAHQPDPALSPSASLICGESLFKLGRHKQAADHLRRVVDEFKDDPACPAAMLRLGETLGVLQNWPESQRVFASFLDRFKESDLWFQAQFGLAWAMENQRQFDQAIDAYRPVVERHQGPTAARAQFQIGECLFAQKKPEEAAKELLKVDILYGYPEWSGAALFEAGRCFEALHDPSRARQQFEAVRDRFPQTKWAPMAAKRLEAVATPSVPGK